MKLHWGCHERRRQIPRLLVLMLICSVPLVDSKFRDESRGDSWEESDDTRISHAEHDDKKIEEYHDDIDDDADESSVQKFVRQATKHLYSRDAGYPNEEDVESFAQQSSDDDDDDDDDGSSEVHCSQWQQGHLVQKKEKCTLGSKLCVTHSIEGVDISNCDVNEMCNGKLRKKGKKPFYKKITPGHCGIFPVTKEKIYCSKSTPSRGKIPKDTTCHHIKIVQASEDADSAASPSCQMAWTALATLLAVVGYIA